MKTAFFWLILVCSHILSAHAADNPPVLPIQGAALLKTDIMGVFAHPDDETGVASTLARYSLGLRSIIANVYCTRGEGGGNMVGTQGGAALGVLREAELRDCLHSLGVRHCYFLDQLDWAYTESAAATLDKWGHEETLARLVRMIRSLRPEVILTMNPAPTPGQHGHHQAAGILAIEAFDAASDPTRFPDQLTKEGLAVWQPRKLYYGGSQGSTLTTIDLMAQLPNGKAPSEVAADALSNHRSQGFGNFRNSPWPRRPQTFILVKSVVPFISEEVDFMRGLPIDEPTPPRIPSTPQRPGDDAVKIQFVPRPSIARYLSWMKTQGIEHLGSKFSADLPLVAGEAGDVKIELHSNTNNTVNGDLEIVAPDGWLVDRRKRTISMPREITYTETVRITPPAGTQGDAKLKVIFTRGEEKTEAEATAHTVPRSSITRTTNGPALDGSKLGWHTATLLVIPPKNLVQGAVAGDRDSSARCRMLHDGKTLFIDLEVTDDAIISNIEPNDIKGHWRSDSVEICLDPTGGAEHTLGCYKLGIFPFDTTGKVRAARDADANQGPLETTAPNTKVYSSRTADGYRVQASIPFSEIGFDSTQGNRMGFNLIIYDGDDAKAKPGENINKSRIAWSPRSGVQGRPEDWGRIDLE